MHRGVGGWLLRRYRECRYIKIFKGVPEAYVPIIKTKISGVQIDFLMARLALPQISDDLSLEDDNLLKNLDERCVRSLGGNTLSFNAITSFHISRNRLTYD